MSAAEQKVWTEETCCVCMDSLGKTDTMTFRCGHTCVHVSCFLPSGLTTCPMCRQRISEPPPPPPPPPVDFEQNDTELFRALGSFYRILPIFRHRNIAWGPNQDQNVPVPVHAPVLRRRNIAWGPNQDQNAPAPVPAPSPVPIAPAPRHIVRTRCEAIVKTTGERCTALARDGKYCGRHIHYIPTMKCKGKTAKGKDCANNAPTNNGGYCAKHRSQRCQRVNANGERCTNRVRIRGSHHEEN
jgi:hypothetical protein